MRTKAECREVTVVAETPEAGLGTQTESPMRGMVPRGAQITHAGRSAGIVVGTFHFPLLCDRCLPNSGRIEYALRPRDLRVSNQQPTSLARSFPHLRTWP